MVTLRRRDARRDSMLRQRGGALVLGAVVLAGLLCASTRASPVTSDPIVGFWNYGGGVVQVTGSGTRFRGTVVKETSFSACTHPLGEVIWQVRKTTAGYAGTHLWFLNANTCQGKGPGQATWIIRASGSRYVLRLCSTSPTDATDTVCSNLTRARPVSD
jgi:hypothetical protein